MRFRCWIEQSAVDTLVAESSRWRFRETGGALLGWVEGAESLVASSAPALKRSMD